MKKTRKMLTWMLLAAMPLTGAAAQAEALDCAAQPVEIENFERYSSYQYDEASGKWSVRANEADGLMDRLWTYGESNATPLCAFDIEVEGNALTGVWTPVLRFYYVDGRDIGARAVSVLVDGVRYDFAASSVETKYDGQNAEVVSAPLTKDALTAVKAMITGEKVAVRLIGDRIYTAELDRETTNTRRRIEAAALDGLEAGLALLEELGIAEYGLWDLGAAMWEQEYGFSPAFQRCEVEQTLREVSVTDDFGMVIRNDQNKAAKAAQEILIESGFMSGSATSTFGENSTRATIRAQRYLGLIETGCMDAQLERALQTAAPEKSAAEVEWTDLGGVAEVSLNRYWFADGVSAVNAPQSAQTVFNSDNVMLAADGLIRNISADELRLYTQLSARVIYGEMCAYEATVVCECSGGTALDVSLLPMGQARLIVYAEIPAQLAQDDQAAWCIELSANGSQIDYVLQ